MDMIAHSYKRIQCYPFIGNKVLQALNDLLFIFILAKQGLPLQYCCSVELWPVFGVLFHTVNVIIILAGRNGLDIVINTYSSAVGEKHTTAARRDRLAFFMREVIVGYS